MAKGTGLCLEGETSWPLRLCWALAGRQEWAKRQGLEEAQVWLRRGRPSRKGAPEGWGLWPAQAVCQGMEHLCTIAL